MRHALYRLCGDSGAKAYVDYLFLCRKWSGAPGNAEPDKADACGWFDLRGLADIVDFHAAMISRGLAGERFSEYSDIG